MRAAAVDIGSNSVRMLVRDRDAGDLARTTTVTRLGALVGDGGPLDAGRVDATMEVLADVRRELDRLGVERVRAIATSALRRATNGPAFLARAEAALGVAPEVITGAEEGELSFRGAVGGLDPEAGPFAVVDLGGGSTEFSVGSAGFEAVFSAEFGSVRLTESFVHHDPPAPEELVACLSVVEAHLEDVRRELPLVGDVRTFVGVGGTMCTIAAVDIGLEDWDRGVVDRHELERAGAEDVYRSIVLDPLDVRMELPGMPADRAEVMVGGACAVVAIMRFFGLETLLVRDADLLDGVVDDLLAPPRADASGGGGAP